MKHLLLLHGAIGSTCELEPLAKLLSDHFHIHIINFSGHGGRKITNDFSIKNFAEEVSNWITERGLSKINIFGYSLGGYVAMYLGRHYPDTVENIITLGTKYRWNTEIAAKEVALLRPETIQVKVPAFAEELRQRHSPVEWKDVLNKTAEMLTGIGAKPPLNANDYEKVKSNSLLLLGDSDKMVTLEETVDVFNKLPSSRLGILPGTPHQIKQVNLSLLGLLIVNFLQEA
jgi:pimeloyl-ACP methyl ester carboxylesterase